jgi:hypothetical protein
MTQRTSRSFLTPGRRDRLRWALAFALAVPAALTLAPKPAAAQQWLSDRRVGNGQGIQAGELELHPGIGGEIGYDSNWFLRTSNTGAPGRLLINGSNGGLQPDNPPRDAAIMRITPSFFVNTRNKEVGTEASPFFFSGGLAATYLEFFGGEEIQRQRNVSGSAGLRMDVNRGRPVGFDVFANYARLIQPSVVADPNLSFNRSDVNAGAGVSVVPGGGTLDMRLGYQATLALFEETNGVPYTSITHEVSFRDRWRFRPRTALFHDTTLRFINYPNATRAVQYLNDSTPVRTRFGITGLLTDRFGALAAVGYGATFFKNPEAGASVPQYDSINAQAEITWYLSQNPGANEPGQVTLLLSTINLGYVRDFQASLLGNYFTSNKGYLRFNYFAGPKAVIQLGGDVEALSYPQPFINGGAGGPVAATGPSGAPVGEFTNIRVGGVLFAEYRIVETVGLNTTINYDHMFSDTLIPAGVAAPGAPGNQFFDLSWQRFRAFVGARWFF